MQTVLLESLKAHRSSLRTRWEHKLRALPPSSAMADPDALVHLMEWTLESLFQELTNKARRGQRPPAAVPCRCGMNPLIAYFVTAEDALLEIIFIEGKSWLALDPEVRETEVAWVRNALQRVASREIDAFCAVCRHQHNGLRREEAGPNVSAAKDGCPDVALGGNASSAKAD